MQPMFNQNFNPAEIMMGKGAQSQGGGPYLNTGKSPKGQSQPQGTVQAQAVRATGQGPYDQAFRQNLATYAGGQSARPGGYLGFNPTGDLFGQATGGGNAPVLGMPTSLLDQAMGGQGFSFTPPPVAPQPGASTGKPQPGNWKFWLDAFGRQGNMLRGF